MKLGRILVHLAPLVSLVLERPYLTIALLLFVLLCYIKVFKIKKQLEDLADKESDPKQEASLKNALNRWSALTWLKAP